MIRGRRVIVTANSESKYVAQRLRIIERAMDQGWYKNATSFLLSVNRSGSIEQHWGVNK